MNKLIFAAACAGLLLVPLITSHAQAAAPEPTQQPAVDA